jgi:nucleoid DNA-binding protein
MKYAELVTRLSEASRTSVQRGEHGEFDQESCEFRTGETVSEAARPGFYLRLGEAAHRIMGLRDQTVVVDGEFQESGSDVPWEIYDGVTEEEIRKVLQTLPDLIMTCDEGEKVKTPLGVFRMVRRKQKRVKDPQGRWTHSPERLQASIRPGKRLQRVVGSEPEPSEPLSVAELLDLDEDPQA